MRVYCLRSFYFQLCTVAPHQTNRIKACEFGTATRNTELRSGARKITSKKCSKTLKFPTLFFKFRRYGCGPYSLFERVQSDDSIVLFETLTIDCQWNMEWTRNQLDPCRSNQRFRVDLNRAENHFQELTLTAINYII